VQTGTADPTINQTFLVIVAILLNVAAQVTIKQAGGNAARPLFEQVTSPWLLMAVALYGVSFILTVRIYAANPLSIAVPFMASCTFVLINLFGYLLFAEPITLAKSGGLVLIVAGMILVLL
jgi:multidrug transporter EmrE-like cation transporter